MLIRIFAIGFLAAVMLSAPAQAFQENTVDSGTSAVPSAIENTIDELPQTKTGLGLENLPGQDNSDQTTGIVWPIPGLGGIGILPNVNFGLELLYQTEDPELGDREPGSIETYDSEMTIRGRVKHRF